MTIQELPNHHAAQLHEANAVVLEGRKEEIMLKKLEAKTKQTNRSNELMEERFKICGNAIEDLQMHVAGLSNKLCSKVYHKTSS